MPQDLVSATLEERVKADIYTAMKSITTQMPFLVNFDCKDGFVMMGDKTIAFVKKAIELAKNNPDLLPSYIDAAEMEKDYNLSRDLSAIATEMSALLEKIKETSYAAGSDAYNAALQLYTASKAAEKAGVPGMTSIVSELGKRFPSKKVIKLQDAKEV